MRMKEPSQSIAVTGPLIPDDRIRARGFVPVSLTPSVSARHPPTAGVCAVAHGWAEALVAGEARFAAAVLTTRCDQLRRAAEALRGRTRLPVFVMNIPATCGTEAARRQYHDELERLEGFLSRLEGGAAAVEPGLARGDAGGLSVSPGRGAQAAAGGESAAQGRHRVGLLGCCLTEADVDMVEMLRQLGLQIAFNATESPLDEVEKRLTAPLRTVGGSVNEDAPAPVMAVDCVCSVPVRAISLDSFDLCPAIAQRPNARFFEWLRQVGQSAQLEGWVLLRQPWCDLFHAELPRLKSETALPWLDLETGACPAVESLRTRAEAFAEALESRRAAARAGGAKGAFA